MAIGAVFLDIDETLVDNEVSAARAWKKFRGMLQARGEVLPWEEFETTYQTVAYESWLQLESRAQRLKPLDFRVQMIAETLKRMGLPVEKASAWGLVYQQCQISTYQAFSDLGPALQAMGKRHKLVAVSNGWPEYQKEKLGATGLLDGFHALVFSMEAGAAKPDRRIFLKACEEASVTPGEAVMVGDNPSVDGEGALNAGLHSVWINRTARSSASPLPEKLGLITGFGELPAWIAAVNRGEAPPRWWSPREKP